MNSTPKARSPKRITTPRQNKLVRTKFDSDAFLMRQQTDIGKRTNKEEHIVGTPKMRFIAEGSQKIIAENDNLKSPFIERLDDYVNKYEETRRTPPKPSPMKLSQVQIESITQRMYSEADKRAVRIGNLKKELQQQVSEEASHPKTMSSSKTSNEMLVRRIISIIQAILEDKSIENIEKGHLSEIFAELGFSENENILKIFYGTTVRLIKEFIDIECIPRKIFIAIVLTCLRLDDVMDLVEEFTDIDVPFEYLEVYDIVSLFKNERCYSVLVNHFNVQFFSKSIKRYPIKKEEDEESKEVKVSNPERINGWLKNRSDYLEQIKIKQQEKEEKELKECTMTPRIRPYKKKKISSVVKASIKDPKSQAPLKKSKDPYADKRAALSERFPHLSDEIVNMTREELNDLDGCTFTPKYMTKRRKKPSSLSAKQRQDLDKSTKAYLKFKIRAQKEKERVESILNPKYGHKSHEITEVEGFKVGDKMTKSMQAKRNDETPRRKLAAVTSSSMQTRTPVRNNHSVKSATKKKKRPVAVHQDEEVEVQQRVILMINVEFGGEQKTLTVYENQTAADVARQFCKVNNLGQDKFKMLRDFVQQHMKNM
ncbi:hypothetical protein PCE1_000030 [Barthelona sp. PCE]